jgi:succinate dehydrogenase (ubiquinone) membrane anchor subunit
MRLTLSDSVNDATSFPSPSKSHGSYHWAFERLLSASLIPVMGAAAVSTGSAYVSISWDGQMEDHY